MEDVLLVKIAGSVGADNMNKYIEPSSNRPSYEYIKSVLKYDDSTGNLIWRYRTDRKKNWNTRWSGKVAGYRNKPDPKKRYERVSINLNNQLIKAHHIVWILNTGDCIKDLPPITDELTGITLASNNQKIYKIK